MQVFLKKTCVICATLQVIFYKWKSYFVTARSLCKLSRFSSSDRQLKCYQKHSRHIGCVAIQKKHIVYNNYIFPGKHTTDFYVCHHSCKITLPNHRAVNYKQTHISSRSTRKSPKRCTVIKMLKIYPQTGYLL